MAVAAATILLLPGALLLIRRRDPLGLCLGVLVAAVATSFAGLAAVLSRTPTRPWFFALVPVLTVVGAIRVWRLGWSHREWTGNPDVSALGASLAAAVPIGAVYLSRAPVQWDARSIWFFHASWFAAPGAVYTDYAVVDPFSHPDYPPLAPAFGAFSWFFGELTNDWVPQIATGALTLSSVAALAILIVRPVRSSALRASAAAVASLVLLGLIRGNGLDGYVDGLAALLLGLVVVGLVRRDPSASAVAAFGMALVKNESLVFLVVVIAPLAWLWFRSVASLVPGAVVGAIWAVGIRSVDPILEPWRFDLLFPWSGEFVGRIASILGSMAYAPVLLLGGATWVGSALIGRSRTGRVGKERLFGGVAAGGVVAATCAVYLATPFDLDWHLSRSVARLVTHPAMLLTVTGLAGLLTAPSAVDPSPG